MRMNRENAMADQSRTSGPGSVDPVVIVVDDDSVLCDSLRYLIESVGLKVQTYGSHAAFLAAYDPARPGCVVLDVRMPGVSGLDLQEMLNARHSVHPIIIITGHGDVSMATRAMKAGAFDFIQKPFSDQALLDRIQRAVEVDAGRRRIKSRQEDVRSRFTSITPRERQVIDRVVAGQSNKSIAEDLGVSRKTVEVHRGHIMAKTRARSVVELVRFTIAAGLIDEFESGPVPGDVAAKPRTDARK
jgi:two-component system response regulator FixJ